MRLVFRLFLLLLLTTAAAAQQSITTTFASNNSAAGNMFDIEVTAPILITDLDINLGVGTFDIEIYRPTAGGSYVPIGLTAGSWTLQETFTGVVSAGFNVMTPLSLVTPILILPGQLEGFYITAASFTGLQYTNGTTVGAEYVNDGVVSIFEGVGKSYPFLQNFTPRIWNGTIYYIPASGSFAENTPIGVGGGGGSSIGDGSVYELFNTAAPFDLANTSHSYVWIGDGYIVLPGTSPFVIPTGANPVTLANNSIVPVQLPFALPCPQGFIETVYLCSNGFLAFESGAPTSSTESVSALLANESRLCFLWDNLNPAQGGSVDASVDPSNPGVFHITFTNVPESGASGSANTVQVSLSDSGIIDVKYGAVSSTDSLIGFSTGNGATAPGASNYAGIPTIPLGPVVTGQERQAVTLVADTRPVIGTSWDLTCRDNQPGTIFGVSILGLTDPMILDLSLVGIPMPGNQLRASVDLVQGPFFITPSTNSFCYSYTLPNDPTIVGAELFTQGAAFGGGPNAFDAQTSNGIKGTLGDG